MIYIYTHGVIEGVKGLYTIVREGSKLQDKKKGSSPRVKKFFEEKKVTLLLYNIILFPHTQIIFVLQCFDTVNKHTHTQSYFCSGFVSDKKKARERSEKKRFLYTERETKVFFL